jgi:hypothetical protein
MYVLFGTAPNVNLQYEPYCYVPQIVENDNADTGTIFAE